VNQRRSVLIVAGETSGEQHAAGLMRQVTALHPDLAVHWFGSGGEQMAGLGAELLADVSRLAAIGPWDALSHFRDYVRLYRRIVREAASRRPDLAVLVDFPEFNLRLSRDLKRLGIPTCYFIGPQVWAWRQRRVRQVARYVNQMLVIFPFEAEFYAQHGIKARYVGNPTYASLRHLLPLGEPGLPGRPAESPVVALLPGSRRTEVARIFPVLLDAAGYLCERTSAVFRVAKAPAVRREQLECIYKDWAARNRRELPLQVHEEEAVRLLRKADCAIIKSGTSTLEAMVLEVPFAMVYRMARPSWYFARPFATTDTYCLANLVAGTRIVPEFVQDQATAANIGGFILRLLEDKAEAGRLKQRLRQAVSRLGEQDAYEEAAKCVGKLMLEGSNLE
jgi:lipid-A-disaccharide synthase